MSETVGVSGLFYLHSWDALRSYVGPRISLADASLSETSTNTWSGQAFFGTEYALSRHFGAFGEVDLSYSRTSSTRLTVANQIIPAPSATAWSTASGVGLLFRF